MGADDAEVMAALIIWAYEHHIDVRFFRQQSYGGDSHPMIRFSRNDKHIEYAWWPLTDIGPKAETVWRDIGFKLLVEPPKFKRKPASAEGENGKN